MVESGLKHMKGKEEQKAHTCFRLFNVTAEVVSSNSLGKLVGK